MKFFSLISALLSAVLGGILYSRDDMLMFVAFAAGVISFSLVIAPNPEKKAGLAGTSAFSSTYTPPALCPSQAPASAGDPSILTSDQLGRVSELLRSGQKILAVKEIRQWTGMGLMEAKNFTDSLERRL